MVVVAVAPEEEIEPVNHGRPQDESEYNSHFCPLVRSGKLTGLTYQKYFFLSTPRIDRKKGVHRYGRLVEKNGVATTSDGERESTPGAGVLRLIPHKPRIPDVVAHGLVPLALRAKDLRLGLRRPENGSTASVAEQYEGVPESFAGKLKQMLAVSYQPFIVVDIHSPALSSLRVQRIAFPS